MIYIDATLLDLLYKHSIKVKIEKNPQSKKDYFRLSIHSKSAKPSSILIWEFDIWFIIEGLTNIYNKGEWQKEVYDSVLNSIIDNDMHENPTHIGALIPYMSESLKKKYAANIKALEFDL